MTKFEYKTIEIACKSGFTSVSVDIEKMDLTFNKLGSEGWELVTSSPITLNGYSQLICYIFKRPI